MFSAFLEALNQTKTQPASNLVLVKARAFLNVNCIANFKCWTVFFTFFVISSSTSGLNAGGADFLSGSSVIWVNKTLLKGFNLFPSLNSVFKTFSRVTGFVIVLDCSLFNSMY